MQTHNVNLPIIVTGRHVEITEAMREYAHKKVEGLHLDYPRIIEAKVILDVTGHHQQMAEIILFCANHIVIEVSSTSEDIYASIDESISKIARRMRKFKTRMLKSHRPRKDGSIRFLEEKVFNDQDLQEDHEHIEHSYVHKEPFKLRPLYADEAIMDLAMSERPFVAFLNQQTHRLAIVFRRKDGEYGMIEPDVESVAHADKANAA
ncbi:MAG: ribosome-associated translation inhibitor RaiA [Verrucomicrobiales bacterium]|nr:ribosome-associated translation inhibitor RaiA [Verrucomicrobiales bacterium]MCP5556528.1 ribosome-associated translation inhibitor RaiA [Verrucomicrobiaceae bacterium]